MVCYMTEDSTIGIYFEPGTTVPKAQQHSAKTNRITQTYNIRCTVDTYASVYLLSVHGRAKYQTDHQFKAC